MDKNKSETQPQIPDFKHLLAFPIESLDFSSRMSYRGEMVGLRKQEVYKINDRGEKVVLSTREIIEDLKKQLALEEGGAGEEETETSEDEN